MAELLLSYAAKEILKKLQSVVTETITGVWGLKDDLQKLSDTMGNLQSLLQKVQYVPAVEDDESIRRWLEKLQKVVYTVADVVDEFHYEIIRRKIEVKDQLKRKLCEFVSCNNPILFRVNMVAKVKEVRASLADMEKEAPLVLLKITIQEENFAAERGVFLYNQPDRRTDSFLGESGRPIGRTEEVKRIIGMLHVSSASVPRLSVISIVGFGGLGKTTLAQLVCEEAKKEKKFDEIMWVCVSEPFDIQKILGEMLQKLDNTTGGLTSMDVIVDNLQQKLKEKTFLLFLDDVWNKEFENWDNLKRRLENISGKSGNFIIVTTRAHDVTNVMGTQHMVELQQLSQTECWSIIKERIARNEGISKDMETIGMEIAKKCGGVPLAAKVIGGVMCSRLDKDEWLSIQHSQIWNEVDEGKKILGVLKLSFDHLPPPQKLCFAYCSLFPKDFVFKKAQLIQLWMAEDFLKTTVTNGGTSSKSMEDVGEKYFHSLLNNCFFQDTQVDDYGDVVGCKMHDLLHDLALSISKSQRLHCGSDCIQTSYGRRLSCSCHQDSRVQDILKSSQDNTKNMRCLFCRVDVTPMLSNFIRLRSLNISDAKLKDLPAAIGKLKHLRYLDVSKNETIQLLPKSITKLYHLQTLKVFGCRRLKEFPREIRNLASLRHFGFDEKRLMPLKVGALTNLQTLPFFVVGLQKGQMIDELEGLKELRGELVVCNLENVRDKGEAERAQMKDKKLSTLELQWMKVEEIEVGNFRSTRKGNHEDVMEGIGAPTITKSLKVEWYMGKQFPQWMSELRNLVELTLGNCMRCVRMPTLGHLHNLKILKVTGMNNIKVIGNEFYGESSNVGILFPSLIEFNIWEMISLIEWVAPKGTKIFPKLHKLFIRSCPNLTSLPFCQSTSSPIAMKLIEKDTVEILCFVDFQSLEEIAIWRCPKLTFAHIGVTFWKYDDISLDIISNDISLDIISNRNSLRIHYIPLEDEKLFKNLSLSSNELVESWKWMRIKGVIEKISEFPKSLEALEIDKWYGELSADTFHELSCLKHLVLSRFDSIPCLSSLTSLKHLEISLSRLESIPTMSSLTTLKHFKINYCGRLESIPTLSSLNSLKHRQIRDCDLLESIPATCLEEFYVMHCHNLRSVPDGINLCTSLKTLAVIYCRKIVSIDDNVLGSLTQLKELEWGSFSEELDQLPGLNLTRLLTSLQKLKIVGSMKLTSLPHQLQHLTSITQLEIESFDGMERLPDWICKLSSLQTLSISWCQNLKNLPTGMQRLSQLTSFEIWGCPLLIERCTKYIGPEWSNICHIPRIETRCEVWKKC